MKGKQIGIVLFSVSSIAAVLFLCQPSSQIAPGRLFMNASQDVSRGEENAFMDYIARFQKSYSSQMEYQTRKLNFVQTYREIQELNKQYEGRFYLKINQFSDLSKQEFKDQYIIKPDEPMRIQISGQQENTQEEDEDFKNQLGDDFLDWRQQGAVSPVKNQNGCSAHWAMAVVDAVESYYYIDKLGDLPSLSTQQVVDCVNSQSSGCKENNSIQTTLEYIQNNGIQLESDYSFIATDQQCNYKAALIKAKVQNIVYPKTNAPTDIKKHVAQRPVVAEIEADQTMVISYGGGILDDNNCGYEVGHKVLIVGYGLEEGKNYWIVKNNWGTSWGESGYIRLAIKDGPGICGIHVNTARADAVLPQP